MNTVDRQSEIDADRDRAYPAVSFINLDLPAATPAQSRKPWLTIDQLYMWGFRLVAATCGLALLFVAAIYYKVINP